MLTFIEKINIINIYKYFSQINWITSGVVTIEEEEEREEREKKEQPHGSREHQQQKKQRAAASTGYGVLAPTCMSSASQRRLSVSQGWVVPSFDLKTSSGFLKTSPMKQQQKSRMTTKANGTTTKGGKGMTTKERTTKGMTTSTSTATTTRRRHETRREKTRAILSNPVEMIKQRLRAAARMSLITGGRRNQSSSSRSSGNEVSNDFEKLFYWCDRDHDGKKKKKTCFICFILFHFVLR